MTKVKFAAKARLNASLHRRSYSGGRVSPGWYLVYREAGRQRWVKCVGTDGNPLTRRAEAEAFR